MKLKRNLVLALVHVFMLVGVLSGCSNSGDAEKTTALVEEAETTTLSDDESGEENADTKKIVIGYAGLDESQEHLIPVGENIKKVAEEYNKKGYDIEVIIVDNEGDGAKAVQNVDSLLLQGIDVLVEFNVDAAVNSTIKEKCEEAGVPVIAVDIPVGDAPFMGANNKEAGIICGEALANLANENWNGEIDLLLFEHTPEAGEVVQVRMDSIWEGIANKTEYSVDELKEMTEVVSMGDDAIKAQQLAADVLTANPDKKHILIGSINDIGAQGAFAAVQAANREEDCFIVNHGVSVQTRENIYSQVNSGEPNSWRGGVSYFLERYGEYIVPGCIKLVNGETPAADELLMDHIFIDTSNIEEWYPQEVWAQ